MTFSASQMRQNDSRETWPEGDLFTWHFMELIFLPTIISIGSIGNSLVMYIYTFRLRHTTVTLIKRMLAALDLTSLLCAQPLLLYLVVFPDSIVFSEMCAFAGVLTLNMAISCNSVLVTIAIDRYTKFYLLRTRGIERAQSEKLFVSILLLSVVINVPGFWVFARAVSYYPKYRVRVTHCFIDVETLNLVIFNIYFTFLSLFFICSLSSIFFLYSRTIQSLQRVSFFQERLSEISDKQSLSHNLEGCSFSKEAHEIVKKSITIFTLITILYLFCNVFFFIFLLLQFLHTITDVYMNPLLQAVIVLGRYSPLVSNVMNPIIYSYTSPAFKREVKKLALSRLRA